VADDPVVLALRAALAAGESDSPAAEAAYRAALRCDPQDAVALNNLGVALERQGRMDESLLAYKAAVLADPTLQVSKRNTHAGVKNLGAAVATGAGLSAAVLAKTCAFGGTGLARTTTSGEGGVVVAGVAIVLAVLVLVWLVGSAIRRARAKRRVKRLDPGLWELFEKLDRDHRRGRL
jgi:tetratricopeptide (TPR) repeat protein